MWLLLFGLGAAILYRLPLPAALATLPYPPPLEARFALFFLVAALLRVAILRARVGALQRRERRSSRVPRRDVRFALAPPGLVEMGAGIGKGVAEAMLGNPFSAAWAGAALLLRFAASRPPEDPTLVARRAAERKKAIAREQRRGVLCICGVGLICVAACWWPVLSPRWPGAWATFVHTAQAQTRGWR